MQSPPGASMRWTPSPDTRRLGCTRPARASPHVLTRCLLARVQPPANLGLGGRPRGGRQRPPPRRARAGAGGTPHWARRGTLVTPIAGALDGCGTDCTNGRRSAGSAYARSARLKRAPETARPTKTIAHSPRLANTTIAKTLMRTAPCDVGASGRWPMPTRRRVCCTGEASGNPHASTGFADERGQVAVRERRSTRSVPRRRSSRAAARPSGNPATRSDPAPRMPRLPRFTPP